MEDRISALYEQKLRSQLSSLESTRLHVVKQLWIALAVGGITAAIAIPTALHFNSLPFGIIATFIVAIFMLVRFSKQKQQYCVSYKQKVITALLANINESLIISLLALFPNKIIKPANSFHSVMIAFVVKILSKVQSVKRHCVFQS
ncbi:hypothetical protein [Photobacterium angustum]|uniref:hypothetical protein n=1 Tax=Photobacterium angustum TaxID=661 RepID=UPI000A74390A|nr:hypothetical protein [Photobacterium angustum]